MTYNYYGDDGVKLTVNPNRLALDETYLQMAEIWARRSKANRLQVGALIVKDQQIISDGYNGMPSGMQGDDEICEYWEAGHERQSDVPSSLRTKPMVLHAEANALLKIAATGGIGSIGATLYQTDSPCGECAKLIIQARIARVVYRRIYRITTGVDELRKMGIICDHVPDPNNLGEADVWHAGSESYYHAKLLRQITPEEANFDPT